MAVSLGVIALAAIIFIAILLIIAFAKYILKRIEETDKKLGSAIQNMAELKKNFEKLENQSLILNNKAGELAHNIGKIQLASFEELR